jgi:predicted ATPase
LKIESIRLKNFKAFKNVEMRSIPKLCVLVGANGTGKSSFFSVFTFLKDTLSANVNTALAKLGGARGFEEVRSRNAPGPIEIELKFRDKPSRPITTYLLRIGHEKGRAIVEREILKYRRGSSGVPWHFLDFSRGEGSAVTNDTKSRSIDIERDLV